MRLLTSFYWLAYFHVVLSAFDSAPRVYRLVGRWVTLDDFVGCWMGWFRRRDLVLALHRAEAARAFLKRWGASHA